MTNLCAGEGRTPEVDAGGKAAPEVGLLAEAVVGWTAGALHVGGGRQRVLQLQLLRVAGRQPLQRPAPAQQLCHTLSKHQGLPTHTQLPSATIGIGTVNMQDARRARARPDSARLHKSSSNHRHVH